LAIAFPLRTSAFNDGLNFGVIGIRIAKAEIDFRNIVSGKLQNHYWKNDIGFRSMPKTGTLKS
jgi:hypothetical protein